MSESQPKKKQRKNPQGVGPSKSSSGKGKNATTDAVSLPQSSAQNTGQLNGLPMQQNSVSFPLQLQQQVSNPAALLPYLTQHFQAGQFNPRMFQAHFMPMPNVQSQANSLAPIKTSHPETSGAANNMQMLSQQALGQQALLNQGLTVRPANGPHTAAQLNELDSNPAGNAAPPLSSGNSLLQMVTNAAFQSPSKLTMKSSGPSLGQMLNSTSQQATLLSQQVNLLSQQHNANLAASASQAQQLSQPANQQPVVVSTGQQPVNSIPGQQPANVTPMGMLGSLQSSHLGPFSRRERFFQEQERLGKIRIEYLSNDGQRQHLIWLIALKNIYSKQLPNMPKEYITRLVFDRRHKSVAIVKEDGTVVGGITYRPFPSQVFGEIAFCAVTANDQVQGYGSRLMSHTKELAKAKDNLTFFLTYADNNAVTFFAKQGFTTEVTKPKEQWHGYIKDYDGGTLMECLLQEDLCYTSISPMIQAQQAALAQRMSTLCSAFVVHQGLEYFKQPNVDPLRLEQIPGLKAAGWTPDQDPTPKYQISVDGRFQDPTREVVGRFGKFAVIDLQAHDDAVAFLQPVKTDEVPDYAEIIKNPMDFSKIERRLASGKYYINLEIFEADVRLIFKNAKLYNAADTYWYKAAHRLEQYFNQYLQARVTAT